jgi:agmatine deiminase
VKSDQQRKAVDRMLEQAHANRSVISYIIQPTNRSWMRDSGPIIVNDKNKKQVALKFRFNGWAKYPNHRLDTKVPETLATHLQLPVEKVKYKGRPVVLEGGAIDSNGEGTMITTEECLLDQKIQVRNPGLSKEDYEKIFSTSFGIKQTIWLRKGIAGDDTHGHIDDICRFVNRNTVVLCTENNTSDPNHRILKENLELLQNLTLANEEKLKVAEIPMPAPVLFEDLRLPASYVNFLITNGSVLVPTFNDKNDYVALGMIKELFPGRDVIGIHAVDLVWGLGTLHCLSREIPS